MWIRKFKRPTRKQYIFVISVAMILIIVVFVSVRNGNGNEEVMRVEKRDVVEEVVVSGRVEAGTVADLGFEVSGRVQTVSVREVDSVSTGALLVSLDAGTLVAELAQAEAEVLIKEAEIRNAEANLSEVIQQQDTLVESAYRTLLSEDLVSVSSSDSVSATAPLITGRHTGPEGQYKVRVIERDGNTDRYELRTFGIESTLGVSISETGPTRLGTYGLLISFPDGVEAYKDTTWYIDVPNEEGASYTTNLNAYEQALRNRGVAIEQAQADVIMQTSGISIARAELARAQANVARIQAEIAKRLLVAPFSGMVTQVNADPGEIVSANMTVVSLISDDGFGIEIDLPEVDSIKVKAGDVAAVTLDPYGDDVVFDATVLFVNVAETLLDNVAVYEARVGFNDKDDRIASGMTAEVTIQTDSRAGVLALPARAIQRRSDGTQYVLRRAGEMNREVTVTTGLRGADSFMEILSGLEEGDTVVVPE